jgi:peptidyl-prolyl cis-trans isomerase SurA
MKKIALTIILIAMLSLVCAEVVDKIIARVGNDIILLSDLIKQINQMQSAGMIKEGMHESDILAQMIESRLIIQKAKELNYTVDDNKIKAAAEKQVRQIKTRFGSEEEYQRELRKMKLTNSDLVRYFIELMTEQALTQQFYQKQIALKVMVSEKEMQSFYNAHKDSLAVKPVTWEIGMIIRNMEVSEETNQAQLKAIRDIQNRLSAGGNFATVAMVESQCPSAEQGGNLGFFSRGMMVKPFEDAAFALRVGEISDVVRTQYGYHLIKMEEKRGDEIRVSHILKLLVPSAEDSLASLAKMEGIRQEFLSGKSFAELASQWSIDEETAKEGGIIGEFSEQDFPELFAPILKSLQVGSITEVLENEGTMYLFSKTREIPGRIYTYDEVRSQVQEIISRQKQIKIYDDWVEQLKQEIHVEILL